MKRKGRLNGNAKLDGGTVGREDKVLVALAGIPDETVQCPFCFTKQSSRVTKTFDREGGLLKTVRCVECKRQMRESSMTWARDPYKLGQWVGEYPGWWQIIDHDAWMALLKKEYGRTKEFWDGYANTNERFAERLRIEKAAENYDRDAAESSG